MKLSEFKQHLQEVSSVTILQPDQAPIPAHFHITEAGLTSKHFIDCGGTIRSNHVVNFQIWTASDTDHRIDPAKLLKIITIYEKHFGSTNLEVEIEYQTDTIGRYGILFNGNHFILQTKQTDCLASDQCGTSITPASTKNNENSCCSPGSKCC
jgi:hypothetical protein